MSSYPCWAVLKRNSLTLNVIISKFVRLFALKFSVHVHQEVRFKILWLHMSKKLPYLYDPPHSREVLF